MLEDYPGRTRYALPDFGAEHRITRKCLEKSREEHSQWMEWECWRSGMENSPKITHYFRPIRKRSRNWRKRKRLRWKKDGSKVVYVNLF